MMLARVGRLSAFFSPSFSERVLMFLSKKPNRSVRSFFMSSVSLPGPSRSYPLRLAYLVTPTRRAWALGRGTMPGLAGSARATKLPPRLRSRGWFGLSLGATWSLRAGVALPSVARSSSDDDCDEEQQQPERQKLRSTHAAA